MKQQLRKIIFMVDKKQVKAHIYPEVYAQLIELDDFKKHGLTYAINAELAKRFGLEVPPTPKAKMSRAGRGFGVSKDQDAIVIPADWLYLLEILINGETWFRKDHQKFAHLTEVTGLVEFVKRYGATATPKLREIWELKDKAAQLRELISAAAAKDGYTLKVAGEE